MTIVSFPDVGKLKPAQTVELTLKLRSSAFVSSVLTESARIARAAPRPLTELTADQVLFQSFTNVAFVNLVQQADGVVFPGGFGAAKNLSTFGYEGADMSVDAEVNNCLLSEISNFYPATCRFPECWRNFTVLASHRRCVALPQLLLQR